MILRALDLFCGGGGAALGLIAAGYEVTGIDTDPRSKKAYPGSCIIGDVFSNPIDMEKFNLIWASPPCQRYSAQLRNRPDIRAKHPDLIPQTRQLLNSLPPRILTVIENVEGAPLRNDLRLTGGQFGLKLLHRPRIFELSFFVRDLPRAKKPNPCVSVSTTGGIGIKSRNARLRVNKNPNQYSREELIQAMGLPLDTEMSVRQIGNSVPPAYARYIAEESKTHNKKSGG